MTTRRTGVTVTHTMPTVRRWLVAWLLGLALLPGLEQSLLAHGHASAGPVAAVSAAPEADATGPLEDCAACQARASLGSLSIDAHPERHGAAPPAPVLALSERAPAAPRRSTPYVRGPPLRIV
ncbi:MAG: hypothetical protein ABFS41_12670 [Myxococcota bacterium]